MERTLVFRERSLKNIKSMKKAYTDTPEKATIRKIDKEYLEKYINNEEFKKFRYLGLPGIEFQDLRCWSNLISDAYGCESESDVYNAMKISKVKYAFKFPLKIENIDIEQKIKNLDQNSHYNLYNLDYCSGLIYKKEFSKKKIDTLKNLFNIHSNKRKNFVLISTINMRDKGAQYFNQWLDKFYKDHFKHEKNNKISLKEHQTNQFGRYKIYFLSHCYQFATLNNFKQKFQTVLRYRSNKTNLIHFFQKFTYDTETIQSVISVSPLRKIANEPIFQIEGENNPTKQNPIRFTKLE